MKLYAFFVTVLMVGLIFPAQAQDASKAGEDLGKKWVAAYDAGDAAHAAGISRRRFGGTGVPRFARR
jgi:hypothetical protein